MDFGELLHVAQRNEHKAKQEPRKCYSTGFAAPKKESKGGRALSANIQKFLARKEEEEKKKEDDAKKKRDELLALRSQDGKAKKRVAAMLKRTKAANKSAIEDAIDDDNTAVTLDGPSQPDEDDYGYVSQEASAYYNKLMDKYNSAPAEEPLFSQKKKTVSKDLTTTKDRVRMALLREEEEEMMPHKRRRRSKNKKDDDPGDTTVNYHSSDLTDLGGGTSREVEQYSDTELEPEKPVSKPKPKKNAPPIMNFHDLLKLAEKKQFEPVKIEPKKKPDDEDDHRPMTKKQKLEYMKEQEWRQRKEEAAKLGQSSHRIPKVNSKDDQAQSQKSSTLERSQEKRSGFGQQMRIPKISSVKREEKREICHREETRSSSISRRDERPVSSMSREENSSSQKLPRHNGNLSRENSFSASPKPNMSFKNDKMMKRNQRESEIVPKISRIDNENSIAHKSSNALEDNTERNKSSKNGYVNPNSNAFKRLPSKISDAKQENENASKVKNSSASSGYDKKLQEAIMAKMQECQKKKRFEEMQSSKPTGKPVVGRDSVSKAAREGERSIPTNKSVGKLPSKPDRSVEQKLSSMNQKPGSIGGTSNSSSNNRPFQDRNSSLSTKPNTVPSTKPRMPPLDTKPKTVPSSVPQQMASGDDRKSFAQPSARMKPPSSVDARSKLMPHPDARSKQVLTPTAKPKQVLSSNMQPKQLPPANVKSRQLPPSDMRQRQFPPPEVRSKQFPPPDVRPKQFPPPDVRPKQFPPPDVRPKQFPPPDVRPKQLPPSDVQRKHFPPSDVRKNPKPPAKRRITDSEEEYDSEMDDFIDDGPEESEDYSKHIREIFGYDRRKYSRIADDEDDDECMESNFATILKEDFISTKTGIMEDLEDIRREKEMERRKKIAKKKV